MDEVRPEKIYELRKKIETLRDLIRDSTDEETVLSEAKRLNRLVNSWSLSRSVHLPVLDLIEIIETEGAPKTREEQDKYLEKVDEFEIRLLDKLRESHSIVISYEGDLSNDTLKNPLEDFQTGHGLLSENDIKEGCESILKGSYTAGGFLLMRSMESLLEKLLIKEIEAAESTELEKERMPEKNDNWGSLLNKLLGHYKDITEDSQDLIEEERLSMLISQLNHLRTIRNNLGHPGTYFDRSQAEDAFWKVRSTSNTLSGRIDSL
jgi:hypothetical protein